METTTSDIFEIRLTPTKGYGVFARRDIRPGTVILRESSVMRIDMPANELTSQVMTEAFEKCTPEEQASIMALHEGDARNCSRLMRIFKANTFGDTGACWLHPLVSRVNHSCVANAVTANDSDGGDCEVRVVAEKHIAAGEEISFSYNHELYEITTARQRAVLLKKQYGFRCDCLACGTTEFSLLSDQRRTLIKQLRYRLHGLRTSDFGILDQINPQSDAAMKMPEETFWVKQVPVKQKIPPAERAAKYILLAKLRQAEGLPASAIAEDYWHAAQAILEQLTDLANVVVLPWANNVRTLMERAIHLMDDVRDPYDESCQTLRAVWKSMQARPCMRVALGFLDGNLDMPVYKRTAVQGEKSPEPYAIQLTPGKELKLLSKNECDRLLRGEATKLSVEKVTAQLEDVRVTNSEKSKGYSDVAKFLGAGVVCAAPVAAYLMMR